jgi:hypothetical protein
MSKRILVVEDQEDNRQIVRDLLTATDGLFGMGGPVLDRMWSSLLDRETYLSVSNLMTVIDGSSQASRSR